jgi:hypothetical protein
LSRVEKRVTQWKSAVIRTRERARKSFQESTVSSATRPKIRKLHRLRSIRGVSP